MKRPIPRRRPPEDHSRPSFLDPYFLAGLAALCVLVGLFAWRRPTKPAKLDLSSVRTLSATRAAELAASTGSLDLPSGPGLGVELDPERLAEFCFG